jgi:hypothetical protein
MVIFLAALALHHRTLVRKEHQGEGIAHKNQAITHGFMNGKAMPFKVFCLTVNSEP